MLNKRVKSRCGMPTKKNTNPANRAFENKKTLKPATY